MINDLVWLVYLGGVVESFELVAKLSAGTLSAAMLFATFTGCVEDLFDNAAKYRDKDEPGYYFGEKARRFVKYYKRGAWALLVAWLGVIFVPSKDVVYAAAAAEVAKHPRVEQTTNKALDALDAWLDKQIADTKQGE